MACQAVCRYRVSTLSRWDTEELALIATESRAFARSRASQSQPFPCSLRPISAYVPPLLFRIVHFILLPLSHDAVAPFPVCNQNNGKSRDTAGYVIGHPYSPGNGRSNTGLPYGSPSLRCRAVFVRLHQRFGTIKPLGANIVYWYIHRYIQEIFQLP